MADQTPPVPKPEVKKKDPKDQVKLVLAAKDKSGKDIPLIHGEDFAVVVFEHGKRHTIKPGGSVKVLRSAAEAQIRSAKMWDHSNPCKDALSIQELS
jgi:hypothetical protein